MLVFLITAVSIIVGFWLIAFLYTNDLNIPTLSKSELSKYKKLLLIFPHPDDEAFSTIGLMSQLVRDGKSANWLILTRGEKGTKSGRSSKKLAEIRTLEAENVARICQIPNPIFADFPDGGLVNHKTKIDKIVKEVVTNYQPDLIITYDQSGLYGHPDHIVVSQIATRIVQNIPGASLWYTSLPTKQYEQIALPEHMAKDPNFKFARKYPTHKIFIGITGIIKKIKALYTYQSQLTSFTNELPNKHIPLWVYMLPELYEYYSQLK